MTKTLTEQWREGTLKEGFYYILFASRFGKDYIAIDMFIPEEKDFMYSSCEDVKEVISPVPSYEQFIGLMDDSKELDKAYDKINLLEKRLEIAIKALERYSTTGTHDWIDSQVVAKKALEEMKGVK